MPLGTPRRRALSAQLGAGRYSNKPSETLLRTFWAHGSAMAEARVELSEERMLLGVKDKSGATVRVKQALRLGRAWTEVIALRYGKR